MYCPASSVPYATAEAELKGVYKRYCGLDRTGSLVLNEKLEVGQKCSSLQHWIHQWTNGNVLFSRLEGKLKKIYPKQMIMHVFALVLVQMLTLILLFFAGVDTILTNIGIAIRSKGWVL